MIDDLEYVENYVDEISDEKPLNDMLIINFAFRMALKESNSDDITLDAVNKISNKYFGVNVKPDDIPCPLNGPFFGSEGVIEHDEPWYLYDDVNKVWVYYDNHNHGGGATSNIFNKVISAYYRDGVYKINVIKAFGDFSEFATTSLYGTLADAEAKKNKVIDASDGMGAVNSMTAYLHGLFDTYAGEGFHTFEYTFEKTDTGFVLKSYKMVK